MGSIAFKLFSPHLREFDICIETNSSFVNYLSAIHTYVCYFEEAVGEK